jgi:hypothetical protein
LKDEKDSIVSDNDGDDMVVTETTVLEANKYTPYEFRLMEL